MAQETCVLDPIEFIPERVELALDQIGLEVRAEGVDWGESQITAEMVRQAEGEISSDGHRPGVQIRIPLRVKEEGEVSLAEIAHKLQQKAGTIQDFGGWIRRDFDDGGGFAGSIGYKILRHTLSISGLDGWLFAHRQDAPDVVITATRWPIGYPTEEREEGPFVLAEGDRHLIITEQPSQGSAKGLYRCRVTNEGEEDWRGLIFSRECHYAPDDLNDPTAQPHYLAKNLTPLGGAVVKSVGGVELVEHASLNGGWLPVLGTEIPGVGHMTHRGPRRMWVRVYPGAGDVQLQLLYRPLGAAYWIEDLPTVSLGVGSAWMLVDLGIVRPPAAIRGGEKWECRLMARAPNGVGALRVRDLYPVSTEQYLEASQPYVPPIADLNESKSPGTLESVADASRPAWTIADVKASNDVRATCNIESFYPGYETELLKATNPAFAIPSGATITGIVVQIERSRISTSEAYDKQVRLVRNGTVSTAVNRARVGENWPAWDEVATYGSSSDLWGQSWTPSMINNSGFGVAISVVGSAGNPGQIGIDQIRILVFYSQAVEQDKVCFAGRSVEVRPEGVARQHPTDDEAWSPLIPDGFYPHVPAGGLENRPTRTILIPTEGDFGVIPDGEGAPSLSVSTCARDGYAFSREAS